MQQTLNQNETSWDSPSDPCCQLLRAVARASTADSQICELARGIEDWDEVLFTSDGHRVLPLLYARLLQANAELPAQAQQRLEREYQRNTFHCLANAAELIAILKVFDEHSIPVMPFKGVVLAASAYGDPNARASGDLDLLIYVHDLKRAAQLLLNRGYELRTPVRADLTPASPACYELHFERPADGMVAELRWKLELVTSRYRRTLAMDWVWANRRTAIIAGAEVPDLDPGTLLLVLCLHGSKHAWTRLGWVVDVAQLINSHPGLDWEKIDREARRTGLWRTFALGVLLAHRIMDAAVPLLWLRRCESVSTVRRLAEHIDAYKLDAPGSIPPALLPYSVRLLSIRDRIRLVLSLDLFKSRSD